MQDTRSPFLVNVVENAVNIATAFAFYEWRGVEGLAWSWTVAYTVSAVLALAMLRRRIGRLDGRRITDAVARVALAVVPAALVAIGIDSALGSATPSRSVETLVAAGLGAGAVFLITARLLGLDLVALVRQLLQRDGRSTPALDG